MNRFLMAEAQLNYVSKFKSNRKIKSALQSSVPEELFVLYDDIMETISAHDRGSEGIAQKVLSWIFYAKRPLTMTELREAIEVCDEDVSLEEQNLMQVEAIIEECRSFVRHDVDEGVVSFSHEQVR